MSINERVCVMSSYQHYNEKMSSTEMRKERETDVNESGKLIIKRLIIILFHCCSKDHLKVWRRSGIIPRKFSFNQTSLIKR